MATGDFPGAGTRIRVRAQARSGGLGREFSADVDDFTEYLCSRARFVPGDYRWRAGMSA